MFPTARRVNRRLGATLLVTVLTTYVCSDAYRTFETSASVVVIRLLGARRINTVGTNSIQVFPTGQSPFRAVVTPSCSALASLIALSCLGSLMTTSTRRLGAVVAAIITVAAGNILRISLSIAVGLVAGRRSLVLFHDWVGGLFTFVYTLGGFVLMLFLLLPRQPKEVTL